jgi:hypothetical protein
MNDEYHVIDTNLTIAIVTSAGSGSTVYSKAENISAAAGDTVEIPLYINSSQASARPGMVTTTLSYALNTNLLTPFSFLPYQGGITADPVMITQTTATVTLHLDPKFSFIGETELGKLRCAVYAADILESDIYIAGIAQSSGCLSTLADSTTIHFTLRGCGDSTLMKFMRSGKMPDFSINPNPVNSTLQITLINKKTGESYYELFDALGISRKKGTTSENSFQIDVSNLAAGNYYLRVSGANAVPLTKRIVIAR